MAGGKTAKKQTTLSFGKNEKKKPAKVKIVSDSEDESDFNPSDSEDVEKPTRETRKKPVKVRDLWYDSLSFCINDLSYVISREGEIPYRKSPSRAVEEVKLNFENFGKYSSKSWA